MVCSLQVLYAFIKRLISTNRANSNFDALWGHFSCLSISVIKVKQHYSQKNNHRVTLSKAQSFMELEGVVTIRTTYDSLQNLT